jgi:hypothetical protein
MRSLVGLRLGVVALIPLVTACARPESSPPATTTTTIPAPPEYPTTTHVTLFQFPDPSTKGKCGVVALPYHAWVAEEGDIVWDVVDDYCKTTDAYAIVFDDSTAGQIDANSLKDKKKKAKFKGKNKKTQYKYTVKLGGFTHDPEFEIWP